MSGHWAAGARSRVWCVCVCVSSPLFESDERGLHPAWVHNEERRVFFCLCVFDLMRGVYWRYELSIVLRFDCMSGLWSTDRRLFVCVCGACNNVTDKSRSASVFRGCSREQKTEEKGLSSTLSRVWMWLYHRPGSAGHDGGAAAAGGFMGLVLAVEWQTPKRRSRTMTLSPTVFCGCCYASDFNMKRANIFISVKWGLTLVRHIETRSGASIQARLGKPTMRITSWLFAFVSVQSVWIKLS